MRIEVIVFQLGKYDPITPDDIHEPKNIFKVARKGIDQKNKNNYPKQSFSNSFSLGLGNSKNKKNWLECKIGNTQPAKLYFCRTAVGRTFGCLTPSIKIFPTT